MGTGQFPAPPRTSLNRANQSSRGSGRLKYPRKSRLTCRKQNGIVSTLTPTMLFTMFMIRPQLEPEGEVEAMPGGGEGV